MTGCSWLSDFGDTNVNPAATTKPNTAALLTNALASGSFNATWAAQGLYCQFFSETQYTDFSLYSSNAASPMGVYSAQLYDLENIIITNTNEATKGEAALNGANENQIAIARILKAYIFWTITDRWGDVPYSEALKGDPNVAYDTQESIYKDLIKELTEATAQFVSTGGAIKGDIAYNGNIAKWKKLANSLRMLMALRLSKRYPLASEYAATEFKAALADPAGHISTNADNFRFDFPGGNFRNPFYGMYDGRKDYGESKTMTDMFGSIGGDSRQNVYGSTNTGVASTKGVPYGRTRTFMESWTSQNTDWCYVFNPSYREQTDPLFVVKASSVLLARAEAADRGWTSETPNTVALYQAGITASFDQWGLVVPDTYFPNPAVALTGVPGTGLNIAKIATQQWIAYYPDGLQGWSNWRRTNYPALLPAPDATNTPPVIPRRYMYASTDYSLTKEGVEAAVALIEPIGVGDKMNGRVWWDKQ